MSAGFGRGLRRNRVALAHRLQLRQGQSLVMTPQLQQAIKLLQLSRLELQQAVREEDWETCWGRWRVAQRV